MGHLCAPLVPAAYCTHKASPNHSPLPTAWETHDLGSSWLDVSLIFCSVLTVSHLAVSPSSPSALPLILYTVSSYYKIFELAI